MRAALNSLNTLAVEHVGLGYDVLAPIAESGKVPDGDRDSWLEKLAEISISPDYVKWFDRWRESFRATGGRVFELTLASRLLIGHGNVSATDVGITVHHTWGVPVIPGSALKGLLAHFVDVTYGPDDPALAPWEQPENEEVRVPFQAATRRGNRTIRGPGEIHRTLFGAPDTDMDAEMISRGYRAGPCAGRVVFHDAVYCPDGGSDGGKPFAADVLTVHQRSYYGSTGDTWPNDYDNPNPVGFLTVRPGVRMLFVLTGPPDWTELAERLLRSALEEWGVGGKTSAGYGRLLAPEQIRRVGATAAPSVSKGGETTPKVGDRVEVELLEQRTKKGGWKARHLASGLEGAIQNSSCVPSDSEPGDRVSVIVKIVKGKDSGFEIASSENHSD